MTGFSEIEFISHFNLIAESQGCSMAFHREAGGMCSGYGISIRMLSIS
jgi:hypothetical protein